MTPYRLVTVGQDGLARMWDIREAALKRCRNVRSRKDYVLSKEKSCEKGVNESDADNEERNQTNYIDGNIQDSIPLPPIPLRRDDESDDRLPREEINGHLNQINAGNNSRPNGGIYVPPLPAGAENGAGAQALPNGNNAAAPGSFVPNDEIDEGVIILSKLQHGSLAEHQGANTRSSRKKINVFCIARCPIGGHFATGSDDGIGRIWADDDDESLANLDEQLREHNSHFDGENYTNLLPKQSKDQLNRTRSSLNRHNIGKDFFVVF